MWQTNCLSRRVFAVEVQYVQQVAVLGRPHFVNAEAHVAVTCMRCLVYEEAVRIGLGNYVVAGLTVLLFPYIIARLC